MEQKPDYTLLFFAILTSVFNFFTMLSVGYIAYILYRFVEALQKMADELATLGS